MVNTRLDPLEAITLVVDPEIPTLSVVDLGIIRSVDRDGDRVTVAVSPTYSGCPAIEAIKADITEVLVGAGYRPEVKTVHWPAWTTDDITPAGRAALNELGIAAPGPAAEARCPKCRTADARTLSEFGSTACKALMVCAKCGEPFARFKELR
ncbi:MAG: 1,2-phenylacetyl-CoA epoxidase subunit PaaD [Actinomycetota bacterium]